jgi:hypothetical protein
MLAATYVTIWTALVLFALGELGRAAARPWARAVSAAGLALAIIHTLLAFDVFHAWSHTHAVESTARQTAAVFGVRAGAGVYVNYLFFGVWLLDLFMWQRASAARMTTWVIRAFYLLIVVNGAVVFAAGWRRVVGVCVVAAVLYAWTAGRRTASARFRT